MKRALIALSLLCAAQMALAGSRYVPFQVTIGATAGALTASTNPVAGYVDEVYVSGYTTNGIATPAGAVTADVSFVSIPAAAAGLTTTTIYTNTALTGAAKARPRVAQTDNAGSNLGSLTVAERFLCTGDSVAFRVVQASTITNLTLKGWLKIQDN